MTDAPAALGRRERNKLAKLERITAAAAELFAERGVDDVTTQEIAERADIGTGTLFLYAKTKGELLLMVQNASYIHALDRGREAAAAATDALGAVLAILTPVVECNRAQVDNGRTYLREMAFGVSEDPHRIEALSIVAQTEAAVAEVIGVHAQVEASEAAILSRVVSAVMFLTMASASDPQISVAQIVGDLETQLRPILPR